MKNDQRTKQEKMEDKKIDEAETLGIRFVENRE